MTQPNNLAIDGLKYAFEAIESTRKQLIDDIDTQAIKVSTTRGKQRKLRSDPISLDDYSGYLKKEISRSAMSFEQEWLASRNRNGQAHNRVAWDDFEAGGVPLLRGLFGEGFSMSELCFFFPDVVHDRLMSSLRRHQSGPRTWGNEDKPAAAARREKLKDLEVEAKQLEQQQADFQSQLIQINQALSQ